MTVKKCVLNALPAMESHYGETEASALVRLFKSMRRPEGRSRAVDAGVGYSGARSKIGVRS
jgi:hypothetical protein